jgi:3-hydroxyisobutyrate dehydrogenase-like beta-hydroxyacid dehydrogenase
MELRAGLIGLGPMGQGIGHAIRRAGFPLTVFDLEAERMAPLVEVGATPADSARAVAAAADVVGIVVRDDAQVAAVLAGADGVLAGAAPGAIVAIHSTVLPATVVRAAALAAAAGVRLIDAQVTGGGENALRGALCYTVGGDAEALAVCRPIFEAAAKEIFHVGPLGTGAAAKLCNNLLGYVGFLAVSEALTVATRAGVPGEVFAALGTASGHLSTPMVRFLAARRRPPDPEAWRPRAGHARALAEKDLAQTLALADAHGVELPGTQACRALLGTIFPDVLPEGSG